MGRFYHCLWGNANWNFTSWRIKGTNFTSYCVLYSNGTYFISDRVSSTYANKKEDVANKEALTNSLASK